MLFTNSFKKSEFINHERPRSRWVNQLATGAFRVEMQRESQKDRTILCKYDPTEPGDYRMEVKWSGEHVPGSPFIVMIFDTQDELNRFKAVSKEFPTWLGSRELQLCNFNVYFKYPVSSFHLQFDIPKIVDIIRAENQLYPETLWKSKLSN